ncbi:hypothetical protein Thimo_3612 [Thioflavicoccus mobilis 8321]|uniref:Sulfatase-modifying factor enzyme-like domain-containing protein n=1 Tax=Thioflavicoccus mobilis 8321 TaxID=765912 RepID=L0GZS9_9GAMM|nr:formylglycine-generating enzyme family protein [Thioflavicoccus mobilis]AGA92268.1 hypothetical protein Thimo_3612 [Thioflavicoccus mobilis 8321]
MDKPEDIEPQGDPGAGFDADDKSLDSVTQVLALEQEVARLGQNLDEKERALEAMTAECRRLEDRLEDEHVASDELRQRFNRRGHVLTDAETRIKELERTLEDLHAAAPSGWLTPQLGSGADPASRRSLPRLGAIGGLAVALIVGVVAILWGQVDGPAGDRERSEQPSTADQGDGAVPAASTDAPASSVIAGTSSSPPPTTLGTVRDRLPSGEYGPLMAVLPGGRFTMGHDSLTRDDHGPAHELALSGFLIGVHEVTFSDYDRFARATRRRLPNDFGWGRGRRPVVDVTWQDANAYAEWLSRQTGERYRLPSEAEWEFAAAGGTTTLYWWGSYPGTGRAVCFDCGTPWDNRSTATVATFPPNPFGLYDTAGNAAEWVADCYYPSYFGAPAAGRPWEAGDCEQRVVRGGAFSRPAKSMRPFARSHLAPSTRLDMLGFRVARDL